MQSIHNTKMCEYESRDGERCKDEAPQGSKYCILHVDLPEDEESEDFKRINKLKEEKVKEKIGEGDLNFQGAKLSEVDFSGMTIEGSLDFSYAVIRNDARFSKAKMGGYTSFDGAEIGEYAWFSKAKIWGDASFIGAKIGKDAWFEGAEVGGCAW